MANEISLQFKLQAAKNGATIVNATTTKTQTMASTATSMTHLTQNVGTSREAVDLGDVDNSNATGGEYLVLLRNMDDTNWCMVELNHGSSAYYQVGLMRPGECWGPVRMQKLDGSGYGGLFLDFDTAGGEIEVLACEAGDPAA